VVTVDECGNEQGQLSRDVRVCVFGDSLVYGMGGSQPGGWVHTLAARSRERGLGLTAYGLGVCGETSRAVASRWYEEAERRLSPLAEARVVFSFGVNDALVLDGNRQVPEERTAVYLSAVLRGAAEAGWPALVVGPPPVGDEEWMGRLAELSRAQEKVCAQAGARYVPLVEPLRDDPVWRASIEAHDGVHPDDAGYVLLADAIAAGGWWEWLGLPGAED
jgi:acyl-CoA thioesterase I